jgi:glycine C-acetyltransferase
MPDDRLKSILAAHLASLEEAGTLKGDERVIRGVLPPASGLGPRYLLEGYGERPFLRMNANSYLGLSRDPAVIAAEEQAVRDFGAGPGAVRFISGTWAPHIELERRLAAFHGREAAMLFSSAYSNVMGLLPSLITPETAVISDELNHNCIINAIRLSAPREKRIYRHLMMTELEEQLQAASQACRRAIIVTDGVFSMRGDHAPLDRITELAHQHDEKFAENVLVVVDDSHGIGALGSTGRGTEEATSGGPADLLVATLGKAFGVNGGYVTGSAIMIDYLRETAPFYIYSNPITPAEAAAAAASLTILESPRGQALLEHLRAMTALFEQGLLDLGHEIIPSAHPVTPLLVRDTPRTRRMVDHLFAKGVLATGLGFPVVPRGDEEIRFQIAADHTPADIDAALDAVRSFDG